MISRVYKSPQCNTLFSFSGRHKSMLKKNIAIFVDQNAGLRLQCRYLALPEHSASHSTTVKPAEREFSAEQLRGNHFIWKHQRSLHLQQASVFYIEEVNVIS